MAASTRDNAGHQAKKDKDKDKLNNTLKPNNQSLFAHNPVNFVNTQDENTSESNRLNINDDSDLNDLVIDNDYPILDNRGGSGWYAVKLPDGRTVYSTRSDGKGSYFSTTTPNKNHLTDDPSQAYSGPVNIVDSSLTVNDGAVAKGVNYFSSNGGAGYPLTVNQGGTLEDSNIFNSNTTINGNSVNNTYVSSQLTINGNSTHDIFSNPGRTQSSWHLTGVSQSGNDYTNTNNRYFLSSDNSASIVINNTGKVTDYFITDVNKNNPPTSVMPVNINGKGQFGQATGLTGADLNDYLQNHSISNNHFTIVGSGDASNDNTVYVTSEPKLDDQGNPVMKDGKPVMENVYRNANGDVLHRGNDPVNFYNVYNIVVGDGAVLDGAEIIFNGNPRVLIQDGGTMQNSSIYDAYVGIAHGGKSLNNTYYSPEFWYDQGMGLGQHRIDGISQNDTIYEGNGTINSSLHLSDNPNVYFHNRDTTAPVFNDSSHNPPDNTSYRVVNGTTQVHVGAGGKIIDSHISSNNGYFVDYQPGIADNPCYLTGTLIEIANGVKAIEAIEVGDEIYVYEGKNKILKPVTRIASHHHYVRTELPDDRAGYAIHIIKNALAENVPNKDMFITPEHCLFIDGKFIPARMLVNGRSIYYDYELTEYTYYHLEFSEHAIIKADGVLAESYLNTNNHADFYQEDNITSLKQNTKTWEKDAAAPLVTKREIVEPLYHHHEQRALSLKIESKTIQSKVLIPTPDLCLVTNEGKIIYPRWHKANEGYYVFALPNEVSHVYIASNSSRPSDVIGPFVDDRRELGVLVGDITLFDDKNLHHIQTHFENETLLGWYSREDTACRWTNGYAFLPLEGYAQGESNKILTLKILAAWSLSHPTN